MGLPLSLSLCTLLWEEVPHFLSLKFGRILQWFQVSAVDRCIDLLWISLAMVCYEGSKNLPFDLQPVRGNVATPNMHLVLVVDCIGCQSPNFERPAGGHTTTLALVIRLSSFMFVGPFNPFLPTPSSLMGWRVVLGVTFLCFVVSVWLDLQWPPDLAGGSPPPLLVQIG